MSRIHRLTNRPRLTTSGVAPFHPLRICPRFAIWACLFLFAHSAVAGTWTPLVRKSVHGAAFFLLLPDGTVLGETHTVPTYWEKLTPDSTGSYVNGTWTPIATQIETFREYHPSQVLRDGRVFIAGGEYGAGTRTGEVYDLLSNTWKITPPTPGKVIDSCSAILPDGRVLVYDGMIFDPVTNAWSTAGNTRGGQSEATWVKLPDDSILTIDSGTTSSERYIPASNAWVADAIVPVAVYSRSEIGGATLLPNGKALFIGGNGHTALYTPSGSIAPGIWAAGPDVPNNQGAFDAPLAMMTNGKVLCAVAPANGTFAGPTSFYEYDYTGNSFAQISAPGGGLTGNYDTASTIMLQLPDGKVLFKDGFGNPWVYTPDGPPLQAGKPTITSITANGDGSYHLTGTNLNGISEGASYGDDAQMSTNYPLVRLTSGGGTVYYARTFNWSSTGVATGSTPVSTEFVLPPGLPAGTYSLVAVANGIPSDPASLTVSPMVVTLPISLAEGGAPVTGTVTLPSVSATDTTVALTTSLSSRVILPSSITVPAGQTAATFAITALEDTVLTGAQSVSISTSASGIQSGIGFTTLTDNETAVLSVSPTAMTVFTGGAGGPYSPTSQTYTLTNTGSVPLDWTATTDNNAVGQTVPWLTLSKPGGTLAPGASTTVTASLNANVNSLAINTYNGQVTFHNLTTGDGNAYPAVRAISLPPASLAVSGTTLAATGTVGGPFAPANAVLTIQNTGGVPMTWTASPTANWLAISPASGTLSPGASIATTVSINSNALTLPQGAYSEGISFTNTTNNKGNSTQSVSLLVQSALQSINMNADPGWTRQGQWAYGVPTGGGGGTAGSFADPTGGFTGSNVIGVNLAGDYSTTSGGPFYATAGPFNLSGSVSSQVRFRRWLNTGPQPSAIATVEVSNNGTTWSTVWQNNAGSVTDAAWQPVQYDIAAIADGKSSVYLRWGYQIGAGATAYSGWNIDDVELLGNTGVVPPTSTAQSVEVPLETAMSISLSGNDANTPPALPLTYSITSPPTHGTLTGTPPALLYTPAMGTASSRMKDIAVDVFF